MASWNAIPQLPNAEVATILGTGGAVKSLQHRALVSLQKQVARPAT
jgi:DNA-directed RNA polymerase specialized sigma24 family protein